jgi:hypothetical protein
MLCRVGERRKRGKGRVFLVCRSEGGAVRLPKGVGYASNRSNVESNANLESERGDWLP